MDLIEKYEEIIKAWETITTDEESNVDNKNVALFERSRKFIENVIKRNKNEKDFLSKDYYINQINLHLSVMEKIICENKNRLN